MEKRTADTNRIHELRNKSQSGKKVLMQLPMLKNGWPQQQFVMLGYGMLSKKNILNEFQSISYALVLVLVWCFHIHIKPNQTKPSHTHRHGRGLCVLLLFSLFLKMILNMKEKPKQMCSTWLEMVYAYDPYAGKFVYL